MYVMTSRQLIAMPAFLSNKNSACVYKHVTNLVHYNLALVCTVELNSTSICFKIGQQN